jgi:hypothetical protein
VCVFISLALEISATTSFDRLLLFLDLGIFKWLALLILIYLAI